MNQLYQKEKELQKILTEGKMQESKFYKIEVKKVSAGTTMEDYKDIQKYADKEKYQEWRAAEK